MTVCSSSIRSLRAFLKKIETGHTKFFCPRLSLLMENRDGAGAVAPAVGAAAPPRCPGFFVGERVGWIWGKRARVPVATYKYLAY